MFQDNSETMHDKITQITRQRIIRELKVRPFPLVIRQKIYRNLRKTVADRYPALLVKVSQFKRDLSESKQKGLAAEAQAIEVAIRAYKKISDAFVSIDLPPRPATKKPGAKERFTTEHSSQTNQDSATERVTLGYCSYGWTPDIMAVNKATLEESQAIFYGENEWTFFASINSDFKSSAFFASNFGNDLWFKTALPHMRKIHIRFQMFHWLIEEMRNLTLVAPTSHMNHLLDWVGQRLRKNIKEICKVVDGA